MLDFRIVEALEKLFAEGSYGTGRFSLNIDVDYGSIVVSENNTRIEELEEENQQLKNTLDEISSLANY